MIRKLLTVASLLSIVIMAGCLVDKGELNPTVSQAFCDSLQVTYNDTMKTLIDLQCANSIGCHGSQSSNGDFTSYANIEASGRKNLIGSVVTTTDISQVMPLGSPLPDSVQQLYTCWAEANYPEQ
ncbi:MAG: hypothetical protein H6601_00240 [Flavobacteriales bacterium]|nr:hypothetical protein [Flavobacteriales bacterium]